MNRIVVMIAIAVFVAGARAQEPRAANPEAKLHRFSTTIEKERPELGQETKDRIAAYRRDPSEANRAALRRQVAVNYDKIVERKKAKLEELKRDARHQAKVDEMQVIVDEMLRDREQRIDATLARFTDARFAPRRRDDVSGYLPVLGAPGNNVTIARAPVTEAEYARFSGRAVPPGKERHPATDVSVPDAEQYCAWLTRNDPAHVYRLPTEAEWELAAGHMPKDADFNCGVGATTTPVDQYARTVGACGGIDFWGNCWEWAATPRSAGENAVKGGAFDSPRGACRTEARDAGRRAAVGHPNIGFRVVREDRP